MVEKAAFVSFSEMMPTTVEVESATLISFDTMIAKPSKSAFSSNVNQNILFNETKLNDEIIQATSQKQNSPSDMSSSSSPSPCHEQNIKIPTSAIIPVHHDFKTDDSFDDLWLTMPVLIDDSQTDIDDEKETDNDIALLKVSIPEWQCNDTINSVETEMHERSNVLEKLAVIKQNIAHSNATFEISAELAPLTVPSGHKQNANPFQPVVFQQQQQEQPNAKPNDPVSLIDNLNRLADECKDECKQMTAKYLLDDLRLIFQSKSTIANEENSVSETDVMSSGCHINQPPQLERQGSSKILKENGNAKKRASKIPYRYPLHKK